MEARVLQKQRTDVRSQPKAEKENHASVLFMCMSFAHDSVIMLFYIVQAISRAQKLVHEQNDLIKRFRGMQGTSDMLEVNKLQENYRKDRDTQEKAREKFFHSQILATVSAILMQ